ncbi:MAG TPA: hypothetical protein VHV30_06645, partial [Polyangiaceae bacterium]|jgi:hypothetical protein|nr:hypothetical protein [Polyangiaceae bacterium]
VPEEQLAAKGGTVVLRPNEMGLDFEGAASHLSTLGEQVSLRYAYHWDGWALSFGVAAAHGTQHTGAEDVTLVSLGASAVVERRWALGPLELSLGAGARADVLRQNLERTDAARVAAAGYPTTQQFTGLAPGPVGLAHLRAALGPTVWIELTAQGGVLFPQDEDGSRAALWTASAGVGTGVRF